MHVFKPSSPLQVVGGIAISDSENVKSPADGLEFEFQPVDQTSDSTDTEMVNEQMRV
jgi:hypothetical protein